MTVFDSMTRRTLLRRLVATAVASTVPGRSEGRARAEAAEHRLAGLESACGGRLGVHVLDTGSGRSLAWRADERFGLCSTFKLLLAAAVLREADAGRLDLERVIRYGEADLVPHAPVTTRRLADGGMSIVALAEAAQTTSDNVAANLLIRELGGPGRVTALFRAMGDTQTRIDRYETAMNLVRAGELRDTTTPRAMAATLARLLGPDLLTPRSLARLRAWMIATETGKRRVRAGLPGDWVAGDKTGSGSAPGMPNKHNDVAAIWPPGRAPIVVAAYLDARDHYEPMRPEDDAVLADVGRVAATWIGSAAT
jgi:beta-lactamase class A